jgi:hypothetical protein
MVNNHATKRQGGQIAVAPLDLSGPTLRFPSAINAAGRATTGFAGNGRDAHGYAPRERYTERRGYEDRGGIGFSAPGVSVGIGTDRY